MGWLYTNQVDYKLTKKDTPSSGTSIDVVEPSKSSLEDGGWILKNTTHLSCNYLSNLTYHPKISCNPPIGTLALLM